MLLNNELFDTLLNQAQKNERFRVAMDLRNSFEDKSQRMLNALHLGAIIPIHRHIETSETIIVLRGCLEELFYNDNGDIVNRFKLSANEGDCGMQIPQSQWHSIIVKEPTIIIEIKDGPYMPITPKDILILE